MRGKIFLPQVHIMLEKRKLSLDMQFKIFSILQLWIKDTLEHIDFQQGQHKDLKNKQPTLSRK